MISVNEAINIIHKNTTSLAVEKINCAEAVHRILAEDIFSSINTPPFEQSAMDGYAFCFADFKNKPLAISGIIAAGDVGSLPAQHVCRIFTGAALPQGADTVVMQEKVSVSENMLSILDENIQQGSNVRPKGSEIKKGELALPKKTKLNPSAIGLLASLGLTQISVYSLPRVSIIITGKELNTPGNSLQEGKVYESNSYGLSAALSQNGINKINIFRVDDNKEATKNIIEKALQESDLLILTGGVSVGDYDYVAQALEECKVDILFHRVKQKPGKPILFGKKKNIPVFGLPGNPAAVMTCFYKYVLPCISLLQGKENSTLSLLLPLKNSYSKKKGLTHFLKGKIEGNEVIALTGQESYKLLSFTEANCIIELEEEKENFEKGTLVTTHLI